MQLLLVSAGCPSSIRIIDAVSGETLEGVKSIKCKAGSDGETYLLKPFVPGGIDKIMALGSEASD